MVVIQSILFAVFGVILVESWFGVLESVQQKKKINRFKPFNLEARKHDASKIGSFPSSWYLFLVKLIILENCQFFCSFFLMVETKQNKIDEHPVPSTLHCRRDTTPVIRFLFVCLFF